MSTNRVQIVRAGQEYLENCSDILKNSELGKKYFADANGKYIGRNLLLEGFNNDEIYVSIDECKSKVIGFSWIQKRGIFNWFPFLHVINIAESFRGKGFGKMHMKHFETLCINEYKIDKGFLIVGEHNIEAMQLYKKLGYKVVGNIPDLFISGIDEILMYKDMNNLD